MVSSNTTLHNEASCLLSMRNEKILAAISTCGQKMIIDLEWPRDLHYNALRMDG